MSRDVGSNHRCEQAGVRASNQWPSSCRSTWPEISIVDHYGEEAPVPLAQDRRRANRNKGKRNEFGSQSSRELPSSNRAAQRSRLICRKLQYLAGPPEEHAPASSCAHIIISTKPKPKQTSNLILLPVRNRDSQSARKNTRKQLRAK